MHRLTERTSVDTAGIPGAPAQQRTTVIVLTRRYDPEAHATAIAIAIGRLVGAR